MKSMIETNFGGKLQNDERVNGQVAKVSKVSKESIISVVYKKYDIRNGNVLQTPPV